MPVIPPDVIAAEWKRFRDTLGTDYIPATIEFQKEQPNLAGHLFVADEQFFGEKAVIFGYAVFVWKLLKELHGQIALVTEDQISALLAEDAAMCERLADESEHVIEQFKERYRANFPQPFLMQHVLHEFLDQHDGGLSRHDSSSFAPKNDRMAIFVLEWVILALTKAAQKQPKAS
jgi:hypothetical protein